MIEPESLSEKFKVTEGWLVSDVWWSTSELPSPVNILRVRADLRAGPKQDDKRYL